MGILDTLFDADARRRRRLVDLVESRAELQTAFDLAITTGADSDKAFAKLEKCDAEIRAARAAIEATTTATAAAKRNEKAQTLHELERLAVITFADYAREAIAFDVLVNGGDEPPAGVTVTAQWITAQSAFEVAHGAERRAISAGSKLRTVTDRNTMPSAIWTRTWMIFLRSALKGGRSVLLFPSTPGVFGHESVATVLQREMDSHPTYAQELSQ